MSTNKRKRKQKGVPAVPELPPEFDEDDLDVSDEDLEFVQKHQQYAGFMANLDTATINKQLMGSKKPEKKPEKRPQDVETIYENRADRNSAKADDDGEDMAVDPVDVLPVKSLTGELHYRSTAARKAPGIDGTASVEERRALLLRGKGAGTDPAGQTDGEALTDGQMVDKKSKLTKPERRKELKEQRRKDKENKKREASAAQQAGEPEQDNGQEEEVNYISVQQRRLELKGRMAELGTGLLADPEGNLASLKELQEMCADRDDSVAQLALLSSMAVFKDLLPGYRIRLPTEKELEMVVSKEVRKLREFESALLRYYQTYVQMLIRSAKSRPRRRTALKCMCGLVEAAPHFNYRDSLLKSIVPRMMSYDNEISGLSCEAIKSLFKNEARHGGGATVEAVQLIAELVKLHRCRLRACVLEVFLDLSFDEDLERSSTSGRMEEKHGPKKSKRLEKKEKKAKKRELASQLRKEVKEDFKEASTAPDAIERKKLQTQTLAAMFETYFRVLKASLEPPDERVLAAMDWEAEEGVMSLGVRPLLGPSLDGLGKFSYLISVDFMADLLSVLRTLAAGGKVVEGTDHDDLLTVGERLQCCMIAFKIVRSNLDALNIDLREFYVQLYNLVFEFNSIRNEGKYSKVLAQALQVMLWENRQHDMQRAAAFLKRLSSVSLHLGPAECMAALVSVQFLLQRYKKCRNILDNDGGGGSVGGNVALYQADGDDPDLSGALSSVLWEVTLLRQHAHPAVAKLATEIASMSSTSESTLLTSLSPADAISLYSTGEGGFRPAVQPPPKWVKRRAYKDAGAISVSSLNDIAMPGGQIEEAESLDLEWVGTNLVKYFRVLRDYRENKELRKEHRRLSSSLKLYKEYVATKPRASKSKTRTAKKLKSGT